MSGKKPSEGITFNNMRINSMVSGAGVFAGCNIQHLWCSDRCTQSGYGRIMGDSNSLENPCSVVTDPESSSELLEYFEKHIKAKMGKGGI